MGLPATGNPSQFVLERAAHAAELDLRCLTVDVELDRLGDAITGADAMGFRGLLFADSMAPLAFRYCVADSPSTESLGAVDTIFRVGERLVGTYSIMGAVTTWLAENSSQPTAAILLGSGIAARAVAGALVDQGCTNLRFCTSGDETDTLQVLREQLANKALYITVEAFKSHADLQEASAETVVVDAAERSADRPRGFDPLQLAESATYMQVSLDPELGAISAPHGCPMTLISALDLLTLRYEAVFKTLTGLVADRSLIRESLEEFFLI